MKYSQVKNLVNFVTSELNADYDHAEMSKLSNIDNDFEAFGARFIATSAIDKIQQDELESDLYILGCFNGPFLACILDIDQDVIEAMQDAEAFEAVGKLIISLGKLEELQADYARYDGYGHHFNNYDGGELELTINGVDYLVFDLHD